MRRESEKPGVSRAPRAERRRRLGALRPHWLLGVCLACGASSGAEEPLPEPTPGYPSTTSRLSLSLGGDYWKLCHATLVDAHWALTAAHCFSGVEPDARGALNDFGRSLSVSEAIFHPEALPNGATTLDARLETTDFLAAHDLALLPISPPIEDIVPVLRWLPDARCSLPEALDVRGRFGKLGPNDEALTAEATLLGAVDAAVLLGPEHPGVLLSARGPSVGPGDSGSGVTSAWQDLSPLAASCEPSAADGEVLMGVIQDANPLDSTLPFGLIPLYGLDHAEWLATVLETPEPPAPPLPTLDP